MRALAIGLLAALALAGCSKEPPPQPYARVKLVALADATLYEPSRPGPEIVFSADFANGRDQWTRVTDHAAMSDVRPEALTLTDGREGERAFVSLAGSGALLRIVPLEPGTCYELTVTLRSRALANAAGTLKAGAFAEESPDEPAAARPGTAPLGPGRHAFLAELAAPGWQVWREVFRAQPSTRSLALGAYLGLPDPAESGALDVASFELRRVTEHAYWDARAAKAVVDAHRGDAEPDGWRARRRIRARIHEEWRPSILCLPGEQLRFAIDVPAGQPRFECGIGPWMDVLEGATGTPRFALHVGDEQVLAREVALADPDDARWEEVELDLGRWAGRQVELALSVDGPMPGVFGAPSVRDAGERPAAPNLVLVSIDTLRPDHVGCYGYGEDTTPRLDELARAGILFRHVVAQAPYTLPSHATLFSGQFPSVHGVQTGSQALSSLRSPLLARELDARGYATMAVTGGGYVVPRWGFDKGMDRFLVKDALRHANRKFFAELLGESSDLAESSATAGPRPEPGVRWLGEWLRGHEDQPFLLFLHTFEVHDYDPPPEGVTCTKQGCPAPRVDVNLYRMHPRKGPVPVPITEAERAHVVHRYDDALRHIDGVLGEVLDQLEALGLDERTIVAVTSDHGEEMFERGFLQHGKSVYEEVARIPMIVRIPGQRPRVVETPTMQADLAPILFRALGIPPDARMQGVDVLENPSPERLTWTEIHDKFACRYTLRDPNGLKILHGPPAEVSFPSPVEWELYDLVRDPHERKNLAGERPEDLARLRATLERMRAALEVRQHALGSVTDAAEMDEATRRELEDLGYAGQ